MIAPFSFFKNLEGLLKLVIIQQPTNVDLNQAISPAITVQIQDSLGNNLTNNDQITATGDGLHGTTTVTAVNGVATFDNLKFSTDGSKTITFSGPQHESVNSNSFTVTGYYIVITSQPAANTSFEQGEVVSPAITIQIQDNLGNNLNRTDRIVASGGGVSGTKAVDAINGVATFDNLNITLTGTRSITFDGTSGTTTSILNTVVSNSFNITEAPVATKISITDPLPNRGFPLVAGDTVDPFIIQILDQSNQPIDVSGLEVTVRHAEGGNGDPFGQARNISGTTTATTVNGVATFDNIIMNDIGPDQILIFESPGLVEYRNINVTPKYFGNDISVSTGPRYTANIVTQPLAVNEIFPINDVVPSVVVEYVDTKTGLLATDPIDVTLFLHAREIANGAGEYLEIGGTNTVTAVNGVATFDNLIFTTPTIERIGDLTRDRWGFTTAINFGLAFNKTVGKVNRDVDGYFYAGYDVTEGWINNQSTSVYDIQPTSVTKISGPSTSSSQPQYDGLLVSNSPDLLNAGDYIQFEIAALGHFIVGIQAANSANVPTYPTMTDFIAGSESFIEDSYFNPNIYFNPGGSNDYIYVYYTNLGGPFATGFGPASVGDVIKIEKAASGKLNIYLNGQLEINESSANYIFGGTRFGLSFGDPGISIINITRGTS